jgi:adenine specific DNA methylase Mod
MGTAMTCEWIGEGEYCNHLTLPGRNYCEDHLWLVYQKGTKLGKRRKDQRIANDVFMWQSLLDEAIQELEEEGVL